MKRKRRGGGWRRQTKEGEQAAEGGQARAGEQAEGGQARAGAVHMATQAAVLHFHACAALGLLCQKQRISTVVCCCSQLLKMF